MSKSRGTGALKNFYDVVISGAGISGVTLAALLKTSPFFKSRSVLVLDKSLPSIIPAFNSGNSSSANNVNKYSNRIYAVNKSSLDVLKRSGAWELVCDDYRHWPAYQMQTLDSRSRRGFTTFENANPNEPVAHFLESEVIVSSLLKTIHSYSSNHPENVTMVQNSIEELQQNPASVQLTLENGDRIETCLLVGAEGFKSQVRNLANMKWFNYDYKHHALVGTIHVECPDGNKAAWQRFLDSGPIASLPLERNTASLVLFAEKSKLTELISKPENEIVDTLNTYWTQDFDSDRKFDDILGILSKAFENLSGVLDIRNEEPKPPTVTGVQKSTLATFPVGFGHAMHYVKPNVALIGDAAHRIHPLAGQGANLSLLDCDILFNELEKAVKIGENPGKYSYLLEYERRAQSHNLPTQLFCDLIYRLYGQSSSPAVMLRSLASFGVNNLGVLNTAFVKWASDANNSFVNMSSNRQ